MLIAKVISHWISLLISETRLVDGSRYPPKTLYKLFCGLLRFMRVHNPDCSNFLDRSDHMHICETRCLVHIYISKLPLSVKEKDLFYMQPLPGNPTSPWFKNQVMGKNTLGSIVKSMCEDEAGIESKTNHSLRATGVTEMYLADVPEKVIQECTGHRSLDGLCSCKRSMLDQHQTVCLISHIQKDSTRLLLNQIMTVHLHFPQNQKMSVKQLQQVMNLKSVKVCQRYLAVLVEELSTFHQLAML